MTRTAVQALKARINKKLAAPGGSRQGRQELAILLEAYLQEARCYQGYTYLETDLEAVKEYHALLDAAQKTGVYDEAFNAEYKIRYVAAFGDDSRRCYF